jgi:hypothetical protein
MAFDKTIPINATDGDADPIRDNFNALATRHIGSSAPTSPDLGWTWLDTTDPTNWKLKEYTQDGASAPAWVISFEHMESAPTPVNGGGGGGLTAYTAPFDMASSDGLSIQVEIPQTGCRILITGGYIWLEPYGGGLFGAEFAGQLDIRLYPDNTFTTPARQYNTLYFPDINPLLSGATPSLRLKEAAAFGATTLRTEVISTWNMGNWSTDQQLWITDGVAAPELAVLDSQNWEDDGNTGVLFLKAPGVTKVGGYQIGDEVRGIKATGGNLSYWQDFAGDDKFFIEITDSTNPGSVYGTPWRLKGNLQYLGS